MQKIHPSAIISVNAKLDDSVEVGAQTIIEDGVTIGQNSIIYSHNIIRRGTTIGKNNKIYQFCSIGEAGQDKKYNNESTYLIIGDNNTIRENCVIHRGTIQDKGVTLIGNNNLIMNNVHIAHDCILNNNITLVNNTGIAGHVKIGNGVILSGSTTVHQFCQIGDYAVSSFNSFIIKDIPAYVTIAGSPAKSRGMNYEGMRRLGYTQNQISTLKQAYKIVYRQNLTLDEALEKLSPLTRTCPKVKLFFDSIVQSTRGIIR